MAELQAIKRCKYSETARKAAHHEIDAFRNCAALMTSPLLTVYFTIFTVFFCPISVRFLKKQEILYCVCVIFYELTGASNFLLWTGCTSLFLLVCDVAQFAVIR